MTDFETASKSFLISGKNYSYAMYVNKSGYLQHLYYGKRIDKTDVPFLISAHGENCAPDLNDFNADMLTDAMPAEAGSFGKGDFRSATVIVRRNDGSDMS